MKFLPESKSRKFIYLLTLAVWVALYGVDAVNQCTNNVPVLWLFVITLVFISVILAWSISISAEIQPKGIKNIFLLSSRTVVELLYLLMVYIIILVLLVILTPHYTCYTERAINSEIFVVISPIKKEITEIISKTNVLSNDYSSIVTPSNERLDFFKVTSEGSILAHAKDPELTVYLLPSIADGKVKWECKAFPKKVSPIQCR